MIIEYEGQEYEFRFEDITVKQAIKIEKHTGMSLTDWGDALAPDEEKGEKMNLIALQAFGWLVLNGGAGAVDDADFKIGKLGDAFAAAIVAEAEKEKAKQDAERPTGAVPASSGPEADAGVPASSPPSSVPAWQ